MRNLKRLLYGGVVALAMASPALAGTWKETAYGLLTFTGVTHALTTPSTGQTTAARFYYRSDGSPQWTICQQIDSDDSTRHFDAVNNCSHFANGTSFAERGIVGGDQTTKVCRAPTAIGTSSLSIEWLNALNGNYVLSDRADLGRFYLPWELTSVPVQLTRTEIATGYPKRDVAYDAFPDSYWYDPDCPGTGAFLEFQGSSGLLLSYGYATNGQAEWRISHGACTSATLCEFDFNRVTKIGSADPVAVSEGRISVELLSSPSRLRITYPSGRVETLSRYQF